MLKISGMTVDGVFILKLEGKLDSITSEDLEKKMASLLTGNEKTFLIDFEKLHYISSFGLRIIIGIAKKVKAEGNNFYLASMNESVREIFEVTGLLSVFDTFSSVAEAVKHIKNLS